MPEPDHELEQLLAALVSVPSVNPLLDDEPGHGEEALAELVATWLRERGVDVELQHVRDGRCNVIGRVPRAGAADAEVVLLSAHMDTYPAGGPRSAYAAVVEGRTMSGRGAADAKGSLAAMMAAAADAASSPDRREIVLTATLDEECLLQGAYALRSLGLRPTLAITGEPSLLVPVVGQKGIVRGSFTVTGSPAHAAYPQPGSAVSAAARLCLAVDRLNEVLAEQHAEQGASGPDVGPATFSLTQVVGDGGMNLVSRHVNLFFDGRFPPGEDGEAYAARVARMLHELAPDVDFAVEPLSFVSPPNAADVSLPLVQEFFQVVKDEAGGCEPETFSYGSEAGVLASFASAALVFGPGDAAFSHREVESIDLDQLATARRILRRLLVGDAPAGRP